MWEIMTCKDPYDKLTAAEVILSISNGERLPIPDEIDGEVAKWITSEYLEIDHFDRLTSDTCQDVGCIHPL